MSPDVCPDTILKSLLFFSSHTASPTPRHITQIIRIMSNPLETATLLGRLQTLLPRSTSSPLPQPTDAIAVLVHTIHTALDFRLIPGSTPSTLVPQAGDIDRAAPGGQDDDTMSETTTAVDQEQGQEGDEAVSGNRLPEGWNSRGEDSYSFEYRHEQSSMTFRIRVGRMGGRVQIDAMAAVRTASALSDRS